MSDKNGSDYLGINDLKSSPRLARKFPKHLAQRYQVLPISECEGQFTVAMANPNDSDARQVVQDFLGENACVVRTNEQAIQTSREQLWPDLFNHSLKTLGWAPADSDSVEIGTYTRALVNLLGAQLSWFDTSTRGRNACLALADEARLLDPDLVICSTPKLTLFEGLLFGCLGRTMVELIPGSILFLQMPSWPIKRVLLILLGGSTDEEAILWTIHIARLSAASVTLLPVIPSPPGMFATLYSSPSELLRSNSPLGCRLRKAAHRLVDWEVDGRIQIREGSPVEQIRCDVSENNYDLVVIPSESQAGLKRYLMQELISPVIGWVDRPVLVAKPKSAERNNG